MVIRKFSGFLFFGMALSALSTRPVPAQESLEGVINLNQALSLALLQNPTLAGFSFGLRAQEANLLQSKLLSNPEVSLEIENWGSRGRYRTDEVREVTAAISQEFEIGGARAGRIRLASAELDLAKWEYEAARLDVLTRVSQGFIEVLAAQESIRLAEHRVVLAGQAQTVAREKVEAGKASPMDAIRAQALLATAQLEWEHARAGLSIAKKNLAAECGSPSSGFDSAQGELKSMKPVPSWAKVETLLISSPELARWKSESKRQKSLVGLEKSSRIPPLRLGAGIRQAPEVTGHTFIAEASLPLPLWNWNQGAILSAQQRALRSEAEHRSAVLDASKHLTEIHSRLSLAYQEATVLEKEILPGLGKSMEAAQEGYRMGKFGQLEVLEAQKSLSEAQGRYLHALRAYHLSTYELERLLGEKLDVVSKE